MSLETIIVLIGALVSLAGAGAGLAAILKVRAEKRVLDAQRVQIEAAAEVSESETIKNFTEAMNNLIRPLNDRIEEQAELIEKQADRIAQVERIAGEQGQAIVDKNCTIEKQADRIQILEDKVCSLQQELNDWREGRRKRKTGPLPAGEA